MLALDITPSTLIIGVVVIALAVLAARRLITRGTCDCHDHDGSKGSCSSGGCGGCAGCGAANKMVANLERTAPVSK